MLNEYEKSKELNFSVILKITDSIQLKSLLLLKI